MVVETDQPRELCKDQHPQYKRGHIPSTFLYCQFSVDIPSDVCLPYSTYEVIEETKVKEGKQPYKRFVFIVIA